MDLDLLDASSLLPAGATARLAARPGDRLECLSGSLWVTQDGDPRDVVLGGGEAFDFDRDGPALVSALGSSGVARYLVLEGRATVTAAGA